MPAHPNPSHRTRPPRQRCEPSAQGAPPPVLRLTDPASILTAVPYLIGFQPADSLVVLALSGPRGRVGLSLRVDLQVGAEQALAATAARHVADALGSERERAALAVTYEPGARPSTAPLVAALRKALADRGVRLRDALQVAGERVWSADPCPDPVCCPPEGRPVLAPGAPGQQGQALLTAATFVGGGLGFLSDRAALEALVRPDPSADHAALAAATAASIPTVELADADAIRRWVLRAARRVACGRPLPDASAGRLAAVLRLPRARDIVLTLVLEPEAQSVQQLLLLLARRLDGADAAMAAAALAWYAWGEGAGALGNVAAQRALELDPRNSLAALVDQALAAGLPPDRLRDAVRGADGLLGLSDH